MASDVLIDRALSFDRDLLCVRSAPRGAILFVGCLFVVLVEGRCVGGAGLGIPGLLSSPMRIRKTTMVNQESNEAAVAP